MSIWLGVIVIGHLYTYTVYNLVYIILIKITQLTDTHKWAVNLSSGLILVFQAPADFLLFIGDISSGYVTRLSKRRNS